MTFTRTVAISLGAAFWLAAGVAEAAPVSCDLEDLREKWLVKRRAVETLSQTFPEASKKLTANQDPDYKPEHFGGVEAKTAFTKSIQDSSDALYDAVLRASLTIKPPCYVCLLMATHARAGRVAQKCVDLMAAVSKNSDLAEEGTFNCDKVKNFTREDLEGLSEVYWDKATRYQENLQETLDVGVLTPIRRDIRKLREHLQQFVEFQTAHPGNANQLKEDFAAVGNRCTSAGKTVMFRRSE